jgi:RNA polymerase sigma factor for flagellar operon FliA
MAPKKAAKKAQSSSAPKANAARNPSPKAKPKQPAASRGAKSAKAASKRAVESGGSDKGKTQPKATSKSGASKSQGGARSNAAASAPAAPGRANAAAAKSKDKASNAGPRGQSAAEKARAAQGTSANAEHKRLNQAPESGEVQPALPSRKPKSGGGDHTSERGPSGSSSKGGGSAQRHASGGASNQTSSATAVRPSASKTRSAGPAPALPNSSATAAAARALESARSTRSAEELDEEQAAWEAQQREVEEERRLAAELGEASESEEEGEALEDAVVPSAPQRVVPVAEGAAPVRPRRAPPGSPIEPLQKTEGLGLLAVEDLWGAYRDEVLRLRAGPRPEGGGPLASPRLEELRNELIERHYPLVRYHAERLLQTLPKSIELDDLISAGQFGLMDAIRGFDPERGIKFKTYCSTRIRGSILDQLRSQDWVPRLVRLKASRIEKALQKLTGEYGREPTHAELARHLEMDPSDLSHEMSESQAKTIFSLSEKWDDDDDGAIEKVEIIEDRDAIDPVNELNRRDQMLLITRSLSHKERFIIEQYYQFGHTMREIGEMLTLTESRVCQIHSNVMNRLKDLLEKRDDTLTN